MNCNCVEDLQIKIKDLVHKKINAPINEVTCLGSSFVLSNPPYMALAIPFSVRADAPGYRSQKGKLVPVHASFCPFCGVSAKPETEATAT